MNGARTPVIAGNWKLHGTIEQAERWIQGLLPRVSSSDGVDVAVCAPFLALSALVESARGSRVAIYAQNMHEAADGPFTGEVSAQMLEEVEVAGVLLGHSERRRLFGETDRALSHKVPAAIAADLTPILCVGETEEERERGDTERRLRHQVQEGLERVPADRLGEVIVAYEPLWAIGSGLVADPELIQEAVAFVRALVASLDKGAAEQVRVLYGGSVTDDNAPELLALPDVDGLLIGRASLDVERFTSIIEIARTLAVAQA